MEKDKKLRSQFFFDSVRGFTMSYVRVMAGLLLAFLFCGNTLAQSIEISGTVTSDAGETLPGVSIALEGTQSGTTTNLDGEYYIDAPSDGVLVFSFIGYNTVREPINGRTTIDVTMEESIANLDELVVVGYGTQSTRQMTGSVQNIDTEGLENLPVAQLTQKLQGKLAGVNIQQTTGIPGEGMNVRIRGAASITAGSDPLYVVDGVPITGDISDINPNEIENISVLKDASATSLYGSRAANGVVLIETRQARPGQTQVSVNTSYGFQTIPQRGRPDVMNAREFATFKKEIAEFNGNPVHPAYQNPAQYGEGTDWYDVLTQTAPIQDYSLSLSTGGETFSTTATLGYLNQEGVVIETGYERYSLRINTRFQPREDLTFRFNVAPNVTLNTNSQTNGAPWANGVLSGALLTTPLAPARNPDGTLPLRAQMVDGFPNGNYLRTAKERVYDDESSQILSNAVVEYEIIDGLRLKTSGNVEFGKGRDFFFSPSTTGQLFNPPPRASAEATLDESSYTSWLNENTLNYVQDFGDHSIDLLGGFTAQQYKMEASSIDAGNYPDDKVQTINAATTYEIDADVQEWTLLSYLARLNYSFQDKYLVTASIRRDGSSRFGENNRWGNFPAFSLGWVLSEESFFPETELISFLKLRGSYGILGNFNIGNYSHISFVSGSNYGLGNGLASGRAVDNLGDSNLGWEQNTSLNIGLDAYLWNDRVQITYNYYTKKAEDLLYNVEVPLASGFSNIQTNVGELKFWGHELNVRTFNVENNNLSWNTDFNISFDRNEVVALGTDNAALGGGTAAQITRVGSEIGLFWGMINEGPYMDQQDFDSSPKHPTSAVGTIKFRDTNGDGRIDRATDNTVMGNPWPDYTFGMTNTVQYQNFDFSLTLNGSVGNDILRTEEQYLTNLDGVFNVYSEISNRWKSPENPGDGKYGSVRTGSTYLERDWWNSRMVYDGSYLAIRNITVGYTLPVDNVSFLNRLRIYGSVQNAHIFTSYPGPNPEVNTGAGNDGDINQGLDRTSYPVPRTISFGVNLNF